MELGDAGSSPNRGLAPPPSRRPCGRRLHRPVAALAAAEAGFRGLRLPRSSSRRVFGPFAHRFLKVVGPLCSSFPQGRRGRRGRRVEEIGVFWSYFPSPPGEEALSSSQKPMRFLPQGDDSEGANIFFAFLGVKEGRGETFCFFYTPEIIQLFI